jgi:hypothetical protein
MLKLVLLHQTVEYKYQLKPVSKYLGHSWFQYVGSNLYCICYSVKMTILHNLHGFT